MRCHPGAVLFAFVAAAEPASGGTASPGVPPAAEAAALSSRLDVTAIRLVIEVRGADGGARRDLNPEDFEVLEDGVEQPVLGLEAISPAAPPSASTPLPLATGSGGEWRLVIYVDRALSARRGVKVAAQALAEQAEQLTRLGPVELVVADSSLEVVQPATRDAGLLRMSLERMAGKLSGREAVSTLRRRYFQDLNDRQAAEASNRGVLRPSGPGTSGGPIGGSGAPLSTLPPDRRSLNRESEGSRRMQIRSTVVQEMAILDLRRELLMDYLAGSRRREPRALLLVSDGYDDDPRDFYLSGLSPELEQDLRAELSELNLAPLTERMGRTLAADGWTVLALSVGEAQAHLAAGADERGRAISHGFEAGERSPSSTLPRFLLSSPLDPLIRLADMSGGSLLTDEREVAAAIERLAGRMLLTYQVDRHPDGKIHRVEVRSRREGVVIKAPGWVGSETPEELAATRASRIARGLEGGDLELDSLVLFDAGGGDERGATVAARLDLGPLAAIRSTLSRASLRVTTAFYFPAREPFFHYTLLHEQDLSEGAAWGYKTRVVLPEDTGGVVVVVEELSTGSWGGRLAPLLRPKAD